MFLLVLLSAVLCVSIYYYLVRPISYWKRRGIKQGNPVWLFGDNFTTVFGQETSSENWIRLYKEHINER